MLPGGRLLSIVPLIEPEYTRGLTAPPVPAEPYEAFDEAVRSAEAGLNRSSVVMCRYAIQSGLLEKGIPDAAPMNMINRAGSNGVLSDLAVRRCRMIAAMGGAGAHPQSDALRAIGPEDALEGLRLARRVLLELFNPDAVTGDDL